VSDQETSFNPFEDFAEGGGLWDGKVVAVTAAKFTLDPMRYKDGSPVLDDQGNPSIRRVLELKGIAEGDEAERRETYSIGSCIPTADGEGFTKVDGSPGKLHEASEAAHFFKGLKAGGFDTKGLFDSNGRSKISNLVGAKLLMKAVAKLDREGNVKKSKDGKYTQNAFYPEKWLGQRAGAAAAGHAANNGLREKAVGTVISILSDAGGRITRQKLVAEIGKLLKGDKDAMPIIALVTREDFHKDAPWTYTGTELSL